MYRKTCRECEKLNNFLTVCKTAEGRRDAVNKIEENAMAAKLVNMVTTSSFNFNSISLVIAPNQRLASVKIAQ